MENVVPLAVGCQEGGVHEEHVEDVVITLDHGELERSVAIGVRNVHISPDLILQNNIPDLHNAHLLTLTRLATISIFLLSTAMWRAVLLSLLRLSTSAPLFTRARIGSE